MHNRIFRTVLALCFMITACIVIGNKSYAFERNTQSNRSDQWVTPISDNCSISAAYQYTPYQDSYWSEKHKRMIKINPPKEATGYASIGIKQRTYQQSNYGWKDIQELLVSYLGASELPIKAGEIERSCNLSNVTILKQAIAFSTGISFKSAKSVFLEFRGTENSSGKTYNWRASLIAPNAGAVPTASLKKTLIVADDASPASSVVIVRVTCLKATSGSSTDQVYFKSGDKYRYPGKSNSAYKISRRENWNPPVQVSKSSKVSLMEKDSITNDDLIGVIDASNKEPGKYYTEKLSGDGAHYEVEYFVTKG